MKDHCARVLLFGLLFGAVGGWFGRGLYDTGFDRRANVPPVGFYPPSETKLLRVVDGDTIEVEYNRIPDKVRFLYINTPERGKPGYKEATDALKDLISGKKLALEFPEGKKRGNYGRLLAYVIANGKNINLELVRQGWTPYFTKYGRSAKDAEFRAAEAYAKKNHLGIWKGK